MKWTMVAFAALLAAGCSRAPAISVEDATARLPPVSGRPGVAYFELRAGANPVSIVGISSPSIERIELHDSSMAGGVMRMGPLQDKRIPANGELLFEPGGKHAMLFGIAPRVKAGGTIRMTFDFDTAPDVAVDVPVQAPGGG